MNVSGGGGTPLIYAIKRGHRESVSVLLETGKCDINRLYEEEVYGHGMTPLMHGVCASQREICELLLTHGAKVHGIQRWRGRASGSRGKKPIFYFPTFTASGTRGEIKFSGKDSLPNYRILLGCAMNSPPKGDVPRYGAIEAAIFVNDVTLSKELLPSVLKQYGIPPCFENLRSNPLTSSAAKPWVWRSDWADWNWLKRF